MEENPKDSFLHDVKVAAPFLFLFMFTLIIQFQFPLEDLGSFLQVIPSLSLGIYLGIMASSYSRYRRLKSSNQQNFGGQ